MLFGKDPIAEAVVVFHNAVEPDRPVPAPTALTDGAGRFALSTYGDADGAPAGEYAITVVLREPRMVGEELVRDGKNLLPARYAQAKTSELTYRVVPGPNEVPTLVLRSR